MIDLAPAKEAPSQNIDDLLSPTPAQEAPSHNVDDLLSSVPTKNTQINQTRSLLEEMDLNINSGLTEPVPSGLD